MTAAQSTDEWHALLDWADHVVKRTRDYYRRHPAAVTDAYATRQRELMACAMAALDVMDAPAFRAAVAAYGAPLNT